MPAARAADICVCVVMIYDRQRLTNGSDRRLANRANVCADDFARRLMISESLLEIS
ncbi:MAG TPA: hypothetical protein VMR62_28325 [Bryobacteraceae bacterium]|jgi:hypothetical protein|nr:hypothetical protein [Bryobacteraceae bacterium]